MTKPAMNRRPGYIDPMTWNNYLRQTLEQEIAEASKEGDMEVMDDITGTLFAGMIGYMGELPSNMGGWKGWEDRLSGAVYIPGEGIFPQNSPDAMEGLGYIVPNESYYPTGGPVTDFPGTQQEAIEPNQWRDEEPFIDPDTGEYHDSTNAFQNFLPQIQGGFSGYEGYAYGGPEIGAEYFVPDENIEVDLADIGVTLGSYNFNSLNQHGLGISWGSRLKKTVKKGTSAAKKAAESARKRARELAKRRAEARKRALALARKKAAEAARKGKKAVEVIAKKGKKLAKETTKSLKKAYDAVKKAASWVANQSKKVKNAILGVAKKTKSTLTNYVTKMKAWVRQKALTTGALKKTKLKFEVLAKQYKFAARNKLKSSEIKKKKTKDFAQLKAVENAKTKVVKKDGDMATKIAVKKPKPKPKPRKPTIKGPSAKKKRYLANAIQYERIARGQKDPKKKKRYIDLAKKYRSMASKIDGIGHLGASRGKRLTKSEFRKKAIKMAQTKANLIKKRNKLVRSRNKKNLAKLVSAQRGLANAGKIFLNAARKVEPLIKKAEDWKGKAVNFLKNLPSFIKKIGTEVKKRAKKAVGIKGISQIQAEREAFMGLGKSTAFRGLGADYSKVVGAGGIVLTIVVTILGGPLLGGITFVATVVIPQLVIARAEARKAEAKADEEGLKGPEGPEYEEPLPEPDELLAQMYAELEEQGFEFIDEPEPTKKPVPTIPPTPKTPPVPDEEYEYEDYDEIPDPEYDIDYEEYAYEPEEYEYEEYEPEEYETYEEYEPEEYDYYEDEPSYEEYDYEYEDYEEPSYDEDEYSYDEDEYSYDEDEYSYDEDEYSYDEDEYSYDEDEGGGYEEYEDYSYDGLGDTFTFASDQDSDFQNAGMGYEIDTSEADTVVGTHTGLNPPRKSYRGSYKNVDKSNLNYMARRGNGIYTNSSFQKQPTIPETRPFKHEIDYSSPTSNPGYADKMYSNGLGELGGSDEFDFSDVTTVFGDDFDVEFDNSVLNQPDQFDINNNRSYGVLPLSRIATLGAVPKSKLEVYKRNLRNMVSQYNSLVKRYKDPKTSQEMKKKIRPILDKLKTAIKKIKTAINKSSTGNKKKTVTSQQLFDLAKKYYDTRSDIAKEHTKRYSDYRSAFEKAKDVALEREKRLKASSSSGKWWQIFPTKGGSGMFGGLIGGLGKAANALFLIASVGGGIWLGSKFVKLVTGSIKETSSALASLKTTPQPRPRQPQAWR